MGSPVTSPLGAGQLAGDGERAEPAAGGVTEERLGEEGADRATGESRPNMAKGKRQFSVVF